MVDSSREAFEKWFESNYYTSDPIAKATIRAAWDAACDKAAAKVYDGMGMFRSISRCELLRDAVLALKGEG